MKRIVTIISFIAIILITVGVILIIDYKEYKTNATPNQMQEFNDVINNNYYRYIGDFDNIKTLKYENAVNMILYKNKIESSRILDEEKIKLGIDTSVIIYKYLKKDLNKELISSYGVEVEENFLESNTINNVRIFTNEYVYYQVPEEKYIFILKNIKKEKEKYELKVLEYKLSNDNQKELEDSLNEGTIPKKIKINKEYILKLKKINDYYMIYYKKTI